MRSIFLGSTKHIPTVYDKDLIAYLRGDAQICETIFSKSDVLENPAQFAETEFIFSTWGMPQFEEEEIRRLLPALKCVFYGAGTVQEFARPFLACGVRVFSAWAANAVPVAEMAVAQIVLANKGFFLTSRVFREQGYRPARNTYKRCRGNYGEAVGIIGAGMVGKKVIEMLRAYRLEVLVFDPFLSDESATALGVRKCDLPTLFEKAFVVSNHLANNPQTVGMLHYGLFERMRENAVFINTGRGAQVVEDDLVRVLRERPDLTALLDVTEPEPPVAGHPFYTLENCLLTPHIAGSSGDEVARMGLYMRQECEAVLSLAPTRYEVTAEMLKTMA